MLLGEAVEREQVGPGLVEHGGGVGEALLELGDDPPVLLPEGGRVGLLEDRADHRRDEAVGALGDLGENGEVLARRGQRKSRFGGLGASARHRSAGRRTRLSRAFTRVNDDPDAEICDGRRDLRPELHDSPLAILVLEAVTDTPVNQLRFESADPHTIRVDEQVARSQQPANSTPTRAAAPPWLSQMGAHQPSRRSRPYERG